MQFDFRRPAVAVEHVSGKIGGVQGNRRQVSRSVIGLGTSIGHKRVEIGCPDDARPACFHKSRERDVSKGRFGAGELGSDIRSAVVFAWIGRFE